MLVSWFLSNILTLFDHFLFVYFLMQSWFSFSLSSPSPVPSPPSFPLSLFLPTFILFAYLDPLSLPHPLSLSLSLFSLSQDLSMAQHFVAMSEQGWKTKPNWEATAQPHRVNVLCAISGQSRCGLMVFGEQYLSGKNKLLRLEPKRCKSFIYRQIMNWEPHGKKTSLELSQDPVLGFFQITLQSSIWSQVSTCDLQNHF